jgi:hypothetical protein
LRLPVRPELLRRLPETPGFRRFPFRPLGAIAPPLRFGFAALPGPWFRLYFAFIPGAFPRLTGFTTGAFPIFAGIFPFAG